ncbi:MAG: hypothetical protein IJT25_00205 [Clostridia bacterium]|nr:hypothetical protein [Clostridia bacterium]
MKYYSQNNDGGFKNLDPSTHYCYINFMNVPKFGFGNATDLLFNTYAELIKQKKEDLIKQQSIDLFESLCNADGYKLLDIAMLSGNVGFTKFLLEKSEISLNYIPFSQKQTTLAHLINTICVEDEDFLDKLKIIGLTLKHGGLAFNKNAYAYDEEDQRNEFDIPSDIVIENIERQTNYYVQNFLHDCFFDLGITKDYDQKLLMAIEMFAKMGFLPSAEDEMLPIFKTYNLNSLFDMTKYRQSYTLSANIINLIDCDIEENEQKLEDAILNANINAGFAIVHEQNEEGDGFNLYEPDNTDESDEISKYNSNESDFYNNDYLNDAGDAKIKLYNTRYNFYELLEIASKNPEYAKECKEVANLYNDFKKFTRFYEDVTDIANLKMHIKKLESNRIMLDAMTAARYDDTVDDEIFNFIIQESKEENKEEEAK